MKDPILQMDNVCCSYHAHRVLDEISLTLFQGQTALLAGPNGCGKSTMLKAIIGELPLTRGKIFIDGHNQKNLTIESRINNGIGYLRQTNNIFPSLTVKENLELSAFSLARRTLEKEISKVLTTFDLLTDVLNQRAGTLSGGQRQALAIGMVILHPRKLYLLDEPTAGLSPKAAIDIMSCVRTFVASQPNSSVLLVEHRLELLDWIDQAFVLMQGKIKADTEDTGMFRDPQWLANHYF